MCSYKILEKFLKPKENFPKLFGNPKKTISDTDVFA